MTWFFSVDLLHVTHTNLLLSTSTEESRSCNGCHFSSPECTTDLTESTEPHIKVKKYSGIINPEPNLFCNEEIIDQLNQLKLKWQPKIWLTSFTLFVISHNFTANQQTHLTQLLDPSNLIRRCRRRFKINVICRSHMQIMKHH